MLSWQAKIFRVICPLVIFYIFCKIRFKVRFDKNHWLYYLRQEIEKLARPPKLAITQQIETDKIKGTFVSYKLEKTSQIILHFHGGAYLLGTPRLYTELAYYLSQATNASVFLLDYRLAPEYPFPSAIEDAINAYHYLVSSGYKPEDIIFSGDSAGGGLAVATLLALREKKLTMPLCAIGIASFFDLTFSGDSITKNKHKDYILRFDETMKQDFISMYLKDIDPKNSLASPLFSDLSGLPPILLQVGSYDVLLDDSLRFAEKAKNSGVNVKIEIWNEMPHDFHMFARILPEAKQAIKQIGEYIQTLRS